MQIVFRDPVYKLIAFDKEEDSLLLKIIDTYEFQRLRRIRQLGVSWFTYPTAVHTRFSHSIGTAYLAGKIFDKLNLNEIIKFEDVDGKYELTKSEIRVLLKITALLHDIGHGPFSHVFEDVIGVSHEEWCGKIIIDKEIEIYQIIVGNADYDNIIRKDIRQQFPKWIVDIINGIFPLYYINEIISSQIDADRMDYLLRDAYMCGVNYARFDLEWILNNINMGRIYPEDNREGIFFNAEKGIYSLESFIISRYHMYEQVYFHKTTRAAEKLVENIFRRVKELIDEKSIDKIGHIDNAIVLLLKGEIGISDYLKLDDFMVISHINNWSFESRDETLKKLCGNFVKRRLYKLIKEVDNEQLYGWEEHKRIQDFFNSKKLSDKYYYVEDEFKDVAYRDDYLAGMTRSEDSAHIWLRDKSGQFRELGEASDIIRALRNNFKNKNRAYCDREIYEDLKKQEGIVCV